MESTTRNVQTWMATTRDDEIQAIVAEVSSGQTTLVNVVKALGEYLTSEEDGIRTKGVELLSSVIAKCPEGRMTRQSVRVLVAFYCSKLEDTETIVPALAGLLSLSKLPTCTSDDVPGIIRALFTHVKMNALVQSVRLTVYSIIDTFMDRHRQALKDMQKEFLGGYAALAEGEKDPRNLLVAFAISRVTLIEFDTTDFVETFFNITFCYFPITFRPPPNDPYGISTEDLKAALRACLNATPEFGPMAIPVFLEKLTAGSPATKRDTLQTMSACFPVYGSGLARSSARDLWNTLKLEIFQPTDAVTATMALTCTQELVKTIYAVSADDAPKDDAEIEGLARDACEECVKILREPEKSQAKPAIKVLCAFMSTTPSVSRYTISKTVPYLLQLFAAIEETGGRVSTLLLFSDVIAAARDSFYEGSEATPALSSFKDEVLGVVTTGMTSPYLRQPGLACMLGLVSTKNLLTDEELGFVVHKANEILKENSDAQDDETDILKLLTTITTISPHHVVEQTLPLLFDALPDEPPARDALNEHAKYRRILSALSVLCQQADLFEVFMVRLTTRVELLCVPNKPTGPDSEPRAAYAHAILKTIAQTLAIKVEDKHVDVPKYIERHVSRLFNLVIYSAVSPNPEVMVATDIRLIRVVAEIISFVAQCLSVQRYQTFVQAVFAAFSDGDVAAIADGQFKIPLDVTFRPLEPSAPGVQKNLLLLFAASVISAHKEVSIPVPSLAAFLDSLLEWSLLHAENDDQRRSAWKVISSIVNKHTGELLDFLREKVDTFWARRFGDATLNATQHRQTIDAWVYISRALVVQNHTLSSTFVDRLFEVFAHGEVGWDAAKAIGKLVEPDDVLLKKHHAVVKILHVQKFVSQILPRIITGAKDSADEKVQLSHLVALTSVIRAISKPLYSAQMPALIPLLLRGIDLDDNDIRANVIETFIAAAEGDTPEHSLISEHAPSLVSKMLKYSVHSEMPSMKVRISALRYLGMLPEIVRYSVLHPSKPTVVKELAKALDDPKRSVRKEAVDARTSWIKYSG